MWSFLPWSLTSLKFIPVNTFQMARIRWKQNKLASYGSGSEIFFWHTVYLRPTPTPSLLYYSSSWIYYTKETYHLTVSWNLHSRISLIPTSGQNPESSPSLPRTDLSSELPLLLTATASIWNIFFIVYFVCFGHIQLVLRCYSGHSTCGHS